MRGPDDDLPLDEGALLIAAHAHPGLDVDEQRRRLDQLAAGVAAPTLDALRHHLFVDHSFAGNRRNYADPRNSFLDDVLDREVGIPISLAVVMIEIGRRAGVPLDGVGMPGHFLVRHQAPNPVFVDPFDGGREMTEADCEALFRSLYGPDAGFHPSYLAPVGPMAILSRMLANLQGPYVGQRSAHALWVLRLRMALPALSVPDRVGIANGLTLMGQFRESAAMLEELADELDPEPAATARAQALQQRARMN